MPLAALAQDLNLGFTTNGRPNTVSVFGLDELKITKTISIPGANPDAILYDPVFKRVYAFNGRSQSATVIDAVSLTVLATVPLGGKPEVAVADGLGPPLSPPCAAGRRAHRNAVAPSNLAGTELSARDTKELLAIVRAR